MTVDIRAATVDPTIPSRLLKLYIIAPQWLTATPDDQAATSAVGTGPYIFSEWTKGDHITLRANTDWGEQKPTIDTVRIVARGEAGVRAAMVQAGEADVAVNISQEMANPLPKAVTAHTTESVFVRMNVQNPVLACINVRRAIAAATDTATIMAALYPGVSTPLNGQIVRPSALGHNPDLAPYPYDPDEARALISAAGAAGKELRLVVRTDLIPNVSELAEALQGMWREAGLSITLVPMEAAPWRDLLFANKEGQERTDLFGPDRAVPDFGTPSQRRKTLKVNLPHCGSDGPLHLPVDGTGIGVEGEGEGNARRHGGTKRRVWREIHIGIDAKSPEIRAAGFTTGDIGDAPMLPDLLDPIPPDQETATVTADGAFDTRTCHDATATRRAATIIPPRRTARPSKPDTGGAVARNGILRTSTRVGRTIWRRCSGYHRRSRAETGTHGVKLLGQRLSARDFGRRVAAFQGRVAALDGLAALGTPIMEVAG